MTAGTVESPSRGGQRARVKQGCRRRQRQVDRRWSEPAIQQPSPPVAEHRPAIILATRREERWQLAAGVEMRDQLAHPTTVAGAGPIGERLPRQPALVLLENRRGFHTADLVGTSGRPTRARRQPVIRRPHAVEFGQGRLPEPNRREHALLLRNSRAAARQRVRAASAARPGQEPARGRQWLLHRPGGTQA